MEFRNCILNNISKLNNCLRVFRDISNFDEIRIKKQEMNIVEKTKQIQFKLASKIFTNYEIASNIDNYIDTVLANHKHDILINYNHWKQEQIFILPLLSFICFSMDQSGLDRYITSKQNHHETYYQIASKIDEELNEFCDENTKHIAQLFQSENGNTEQLEMILQNLQKTADTNPSGVVYVKYKRAIMELSFILNKLISETKTKLVTDINKSCEITNKTILTISNKLQSVKHGVITIMPHLLYLKAENERKKIEQEEKSLGLLSKNRIQHLMEATLESIKRRNFIQCLFGHNFVCCFVSLFCFVQKKYIYLIFTKTNKKVKRYWIIFQN